MNRIFRFNGGENKQSRSCRQKSQQACHSSSPLDGVPRSPIAPPSNTRGKCAFCGCDLEGCLFTAWSIANHNPTVAICRACIDDFAVHSKFTRTFGIWYERKPDYRPLQAKLLRRLAGETGSAALKETIVSVCLRLVKRTSALLGGCRLRHCRKTGVPLEVPRIAVITAEKETCCNLLGIACAEVGLVCMPCDLLELNAGTAYDRLVSCCTNACWANHAVLCCEDYIESQIKSAIVYACGSDNRIPEEIKKYVVDDSGE